MNHYLKTNFQYTQFKYLNLKSIKLKVGNNNSNINIKNKELIFKSNYNNKLGKELTIYHEFFRLFIS